MARDYAKTIGYLIAKAEKAQEMGNIHEAKAYREKAETLMREYRISEEETIAGDQFAITPIVTKIVLMESGARNNPLRQHYYDLWWVICKHAGVRTLGRITLEGQVVATAVGYEMDIKLAEFLWIAARLVFLTRIDARRNPELSDQVNCYFMRNSGMKRNDIAEELWGSARNDGHAHGRVQRLYLAECAVRGEEPRVSGRGIQVRTYREAYATGFVSEFGWRLSEARDAADSVGGTLELPGRRERVEEAFYAEFPHLRPMSAEKLAEWRKQCEEEEANCRKCKGDRKCKEHGERKMTASERKAYYRKYQSPEAQAGHANGAAAARSVNVERTAGERSQRADAAPERAALNG